MTTVPPPPTDDAAGDPTGDTLSEQRALSARLAAAEAARLAAEVRIHEEHVARLQAETNARAADDARLVAEARVRELEGQLSALLDAQDAAEEAAAAAAASEPAEPEADDPNSLSLFDGAQPVDDPPRGAADNDPALPKVLIGSAVVAGLATLLAFFSGNVGLGLLMLAITVGLLWALNATRVPPIEISVNRGIVYIDQGESKHRFDLRNERTQVEMSGRPGDRDWEVRFLRRALDPFVVRAGMIDDAEGFVRSLRQWRPDL
jgi:hypothetical protein